MVDELFRRFLQRNDAQTLDCWIFNSSFPLQIPQTCYCEAIIAINIVLNVYLLLSIRAWLYRQARKARSPAGALSKTCFARLTHPGSARPGLPKKTVKMMNERERSEAMLAFYLEPIPSCAQVGRFRKPATSPRKSAIISRVDCSTARCQSLAYCWYSVLSWAKMIARELLTNAPCPLSSNPIATSLAVPP